MKITITESQYNKLMEGFVNIPVDEDIALELWEDEKKLELSSIVIPKHLRGQGKGTEVMNKVIEYSEEVNKPIYLTPDTNFGGTSINRLKRFYRRFGFTKNTDQEVSHSMVRYPKEMNKSQTTNELNIKDKTIINHGVEHNIYKSIKYPNKLIKVGPDFIVNEWYYMFEENPDIFPKVYGMYPLKNREWIRKIGIKWFQQHNFFDESEYYYVVIEELDTNKFLNLWNRMNDVNKEVNDVNKPPSFLFYMINNPYKYEDNWDKLLNHTKDTTISNEVEMFYSLIKKLHEVKDGPDLHQGQFGFDSEGVLKALDI